MEGVLPKYRQPLIIKGPRTFDDAITAAMDLDPKFWIPILWLLESIQMVRPTNSVKQCAKVFLTSARQ